MPNRHDQWYFISRLNRRVHIVTVPEDEWTYELTTRPASVARPNDIVLKDQVAFDEILAGLHLIKHGAGRQVANCFIRLTRLDSLSPITRSSVQRMRRMDAPK